MLQSCVGIQRREYRIDGYCGLRDKVFVRCTLVNLICRCGSPFARGANREGRWANLARSRMEFVLVICAGLRWKSKASCPSAVVVAFPPAPPRTNRHESRCCPCNSPGHTRIRFAESTAAAGFRFRPFSALSTLANAAEPAAGSVKIIGLAGSRRKGKTTYKAVELALASAKTVSPAIATELIELFRAQS